MRRRLIQNGLLVFCWALLATGLIGCAAGSGSSASAQQGGQFGEADETSEGNEGHVSPPTPIFRTVLVQTEGLNECAQAETVELWLGVSGFSLVELNGTALLDAAFTDTNVIPLFVQGESIQTTLGSELLDVSALSASILDIDFVFVSFSDGDVWRGLFYVDPDAFVTNDLSVAMSELSQSTGIALADISIIVATKPLSLEIDLIEALAAEVDPSQEEALLYVATGIAVDTWCHATEFILDKPELDLTAAKSVDEILSDAVLESVYVAVTEAATPEEEDFEEAKVKRVKHRGKGRRGKGLEASEAGKGKAAEHSDNNGPSKSAAKSQGKSSVAIGTPPSSPPPTEPPPSSPPSSPEPGPPPDTGPDDDPGKSAGKSQGKGKGKAK